MDEFETKSKLKDAPTTIALTIYQDETDKRWKLARIEYTPLTKKAKLLEIIDCGETKIHAISRYNIESYSARNNAP